MNKFLFRGLVFALACLCSGLAMAEVVVPVSIGGTKILMATDDGYLRTSEKLSNFHAVLAASVPPANRLAEAFVSEVDAKCLMLGLQWQDTFFAMQTLRNAEGLDFSAAEWAEGRPQVAKAMGVLDLNALAGDRPGADARMSAAAGMKVSTKFGEIGKPKLYDSHDQSLRFVLLLPMSVEVAGQARTMTLECAGAITRISSKLVYLYAYRKHVEGDDTSEVRAALDRFVDRAIALNPDAPVLATKPGLVPAAEVQ